ncbi:integrase core domain-containing protein, partial [Thermodesulfatator atlanticus]|uniref:integrase core domain-containing protein n=2 Tax=Thermodesulfatator atlanticus TaxID=501497 RepID=UPI0003B7345A
TSKKFVSEMKNLQIKQILTSYSNPKGNAETERMIRTIKEELIWISEFRNLIEAKDRIGDWIRRYNREYVHSALSYMSPEKFEARYYEGRYREAA